MRSFVRSSLCLAALSGAAIIVAASPADAVHRAGPPWISIEYPANPLDPSTRGAYLLVHAFHHQLPVSSPVRGTAEGLVGGARKSITLRFDSTTRPGVYALRKQWGDEGVWSLVISVVPHEDNIAQALVELGPDGVTSVRVPTRREREWTIPRPITAQEIEQSLQSRASRTAARR
ncbi:MAG TPA: hypothetical protein VFD67_04755 [Gemmatimonadaceae bacterium]|nr:hypothetical protein [Gemmatimonadaceae bacterium]